VTVAATESEMEPQSTTPAPVPSLGTAVRESFSDFYYHSIRLVPANLVWGAAFIAAVFVTTVWLLGGLVLLVLLALPTAGIYRLSALTVRAEDVNLSDAFRAYRVFARSALVLGAVGILGAALCIVNILTGFFGIGGALGWALGTAALWGLVALWAWLLVVWPLVVDPRRAHTPLRAKARLAALMVLAFPLRIAALLALTALVVAVSTVLFAALVTIGIAFVTLVGCHHVLPAADRLEAQLAGSGTR
jgi:hypothetical protein